MTDHGRLATRRALLAGLVLALLLLAFALRVHRLGDQRVWWDEGWSVWAARFALQDILRQTGNDVHPPLYFALLHAWRSLSGDSEFGLRLASSFLGTLTVAMTYVFGRDVGRKLPGDPPAHGVGLLAGLFLAVSRFHIAWSQEIRMYALASLLAVVALWAARRVWDRGARADLILYVAAMTAGLYTLYLFAIIFLAANLVWLWVWWRAADRRREALRWLALQAAVVLLFLPWAMYAAGGFLSTASAQPIAMQDFLHIYWTVIAYGVPLDVARYNQITLPALAIFLFSVGALVWEGVRRRRVGPKAAPWPMLRDVVLLLVVLLLPAGVVYFASLPRQNFYNPPFSPRYLVIFTSFYSVALSWGLFTLGRRLGGQRGDKPSVGPFLAPALAVFMILVALSGLAPYYPGRVLVDDYKSLVDTIEAYKQPGDAVVLYTDTDWPIFAYHHPDSWLGVPHQWTITPETAANYLGPIWDSHDGLWLVTTPYRATADPQRHMPAWLAAQASAQRDYDYGDNALSFYARTAGRAATADQLAPDSQPPHELAIPLPYDAALLGYGQAARDFKSGETARLFLYWQGDEAVQTAVSLVDSSGQSWATVPVTLPASSALARQQVDILVPPEAPSGDYHFSIAAAGDRHETFGELTITQRQSEFLTAADVTIDRSLEVSFANGIRLPGYDLPETSAAPGATLPLTLYWTTDEAVGERYTVFTHLLGETFNATTGNFLWGQRDNEPAANTRPTTTWRVGEVVVDDYAIPIQADAPPGDYRIEIGLYNPLTGERLAVVDDVGAATADHVALTTVEVMP